MCGRKFEGPYQIFRFEFDSDRPAEPATGCVQRRQAVDPGMGEQGWLERGRDHAMLRYPKGISQPF